MGKQRWKSVGLPGAFAPWVRRLQGVGGSYVVRDATSHRTLYNGQAANLYQALTRHFQRWRGSTAGPVFDRTAVEVAVRISPAPRPGGYRFVLSRSGYELRPVVGADLAARHVPAGDAAVELVAGMLQGLKPEELAKLKDRLEENPPCTSPSSPSSAPRSER